MLNQSCPCGNVGRLPKRTAYGQALKHGIPHRESKIFPTLRPYTARYGKTIHAVKVYPNPIVGTNVSYGGKIGYSELPQVQRLPPWQRVRKGL